MRGARQEADKENWERTGPNSTCPRSGKCSQCSLINPIGTQEIGQNKADKSKNAGYGHTLTYTGKNARTRETNNEELTQRTGHRMDKQLHTWQQSRIQVRWEIWREREFFFLRLQHD